MAARYGGMMSRIMLATLPPKLKEIQDTRVLTCTQVTACTVVA